MPFSVISVLESEVNTMPRAENVRIEALPPEEYKGMKLRFEYESEIYYDVRIHDTPKGFSVDFVRMPFPVPKQNSFESQLYESHWDAPEAFGIFDKDKLVAVMEITPEQWNNRLRVTNLWVNGGYRRQGLGRILMDRAKTIAINRKNRAVVLETQSCNANAISFYLSQGFMLSGFDGFAYSNEDIERKEVRVEMLLKTPRTKNY